MTSFRCRRCGSCWQEGPTRDFREDQVCRYCLHADALGFHRDREGEAEASEAGTERARANYYHNYSNLLKELNDSYRDFLLKSNPQRLNDATPREWDLGTRCYYLEKDNNALRELCEEYRKTLEEYAAKIN